MKLKEFLCWRHSSLMLALSALTILNVQAQDYPVTFHEVQGVAGKPVGNIRNITQDPSGYMWFSAEGEKGLYRYDGKKMTIYRPDYMEPNTLGGVDINVVYADPRGIIWVGFGGDGLDRFDPATNTFTHFRHDEANKKSLGGEGAGALLMDGNGNLWVGTNGLDRLDEKTGEFVHYKNEPGNSRSLSSNNVCSIYEDSHGVIWVGTDSYPWVWPDPQAGGLNRMESDGGFVRYMHDPNDPHSLVSNKVLSILEDSRGVFWVGTAGDGLHTLDRSTGKFERHSYNPVHPDKLSRPPLIADEQRKSWDQITFIVEDHTGAIWIGALFGGLSRYDPLSQKVTRYENSKDYAEGVTWNAFVSEDGVLWISDQPKLYRVDPARKVFDNVSLGTHATRFFEDEDGSLWTGSGAGLLHLDRNGKVLRKFDVKYGDNQDIAVELFREGRDAFMLGAHHGVYQMNVKTGKYTKVDLGFISELTIQIRKDADGYKWITTTEGGLVKYQDGKGVVKRYTYNYADQASIGSNHVICVLPEGDHVWVGTGGGGINRLDKATDKFTHYLPTAKVTSFYKDRAGVLWVGTSNGLYRYDNKNDSFAPAGFHSVIATDRTYGIMEDEKANLWVATPSAVVRIDSARQTVSQFGEQNGIEANSISPGSIFKNQKGDLLVGKDGGYLRISTRDFAFVAESPKIFITEFEVNNTSVGLVVGEKFNNVVLDHNQNNISISFAMADYRDPDGNQFYAKLENFDSEWREELGNNTSYYFSVPPGSYVYRLKAYTSGGATAEKSIIITINPPWWKTWWAYVGYSLIALGMLFGARRTVVHQERLKANLQLEHLELEKAKEVDRVKNTFFANISHEFRTPLTLIKGPVQELLEKYADDPHVKERLKLVQRNSDLLLKLINQLLDLARLEAGSLKVEKSEGDVYSYLRAIANSFESFARQKGVSLSVEVPVITRMANFDKDKVETVLINLVNNAIKFTPAGGSVHFQARVEDDVLRFSVKDTGIGVPAEQHQKIFERFHQVSEAHKEVGTGIGLALVKELIAFMNGSIEIKSEVGKGTEFSVTLPIELISVSKSQTPDFQNQSASAVSSNGHGKTALPVPAGESNGHENVGSKPSILVVEDNADLRAFIIDSLGQEFFFLEAENGKLGLDVAIREVPDMIISDVMMPEMDGITMSGKIKADIRTNHIPLIILTAKTAEDSKLQGLQSGADDYLTKPFNKNELLLKVRNGVGRQVKLREKLRMELLSSAPKIEALNEDEKFLNQVKEKILERLSDEQLSVESLGEDIGLSRSQLLRKVTALTGLSVNELIRKLRLQRAEQLIRQNWGPVSQVAYEVGFSSLSYFSKVFKEEYGSLPSEYTERT